VTQNRGAPLKQDAVGHRVRRGQLRLTLSLRYILVQKANEEIPKVFINTEFVNNAIKEPVILGNLPSYPAIAVATFHLRSKLFTFMLKRNHSTRNGAVSATLPATSRPRVPAASPSWSDFQ